MSFMTQLSRRGFLQVGAGVSTLVGSGQAYGDTVDREQPTQTPNILLLICDQLNASVLGCYGGPVPTPHIDCLASEGVLFTDAVCVYPICSPTRASLITGKYPHAHGILHNVAKRDYPAMYAPDTQEGIKASDRTTEKILHAAGYSTHHYGKWHLLDDDLPYYTDMYGEHREYAAEMAEVFEKVKQEPPETWLNWYGWILPVDVEKRFQAACAEASGRWSKRGNAAEFLRKMGRLELETSQVFDVRVADKTIERLRTVGDESFMITCSLNEPHDPNVVPSPYYEMFSPDEIELPANYASRAKRFENEWSRKFVSDLGERGELGVQEFLRVYYAMVRLVDDQVGRILETLRTTGQDRNTVVVFTADHGDMAGGHGMVWKSTSSFYDEVARVPLIVRYPGQIQPGKSDVPTDSTDLMPTLLDLVGKPIPKDVQGKSLKPFLVGEKVGSDFDGYAFCERIPPNRRTDRTIEPNTPAHFMVRGNGWKYCLYADGEAFLYDLENDPLETTNLANTPKYRDIQARLEKERLNWLERTG